MFFLNTSLFLLSYSWCKCCVSFWSTAKVIQLYIYIRLFSIIVYHKIVNIVPFGHLKIFLLFTLFFKSILLKLHAVKSTLKHCDHCRGSRASSALDPERPPGSAPWRSHSAPHLPPRKLPFVFQGPPPPTAHPVNPPHTSPVRSHRTGYSITLKVSSAPPVPCSNFHPLRLAHALCVIGTK